MRERAPQVCRMFSLYFIMEFGGRLGKKKVIMRSRDQVYDERIWDILKIL